MLRRFAQNLAGNMSILMVGTIGVAMFIAANVIDYASLTIQKQSIQGLADRAALGAAQELIVAQASDARVTAVAQAIVKASYEGEQVTTATIIDGNTAVHVTIEATPKTFFNGPMASGVDRLRSEATAEVSGGGNICMLGLDKTAIATLKLSNRARLSAPECAVYSNSVSEKSLWLADTSRVYADNICVAGGVQGPETSFTLNQPTLDCPQLEDPLRNRPNPDVGDLEDCDYTNVRIMPMQDKRLRPGIYCGGITIAGGRARLDPGIYVIKDGQLNVTGILEGEGVGFFLTGRSATIQFTKISSISLTAPRDGEMAGMLFFEDRNTEFETYHRITSLDARNLVGTMYLPKSKLLIDAANPVADKSDYTVIIAREFELRDGPELVLNTDYENSAVPVPEGLGNNTKTIVRLTE
jgi:Flp pilus assembly protein TadG